MMQDVRMKLNLDCHGKSRIQQGEDSFHQQNGLISLRKKLVNLYGAETCTLHKVDHKYLKVLKCNAGEG